MPLSEHVYCVAIAFKVTEQVEQRDCIQFCVKLVHFLHGLYLDDAEATAVGNW